MPEESDAGYKEVSNYTSNEEIMDLQEGVFGDLEELYEKVENFGDETYEVVGGAFGKYLSEAREINREEYKKALIEVGNALEGIEKRAGEVSEDAIKNAMEDIKYKPEEGSREAPESEETTEETYDEEEEDWISKYLDTPSFGIDYKASWKATGDILGMPSQVADHKRQGNPNWHKFFSDQ